MKFIYKNIAVIAGVITGAAGGYLYYRYVGCMSGSCAITSSPVNSTIYGAVLGWLLGGIFQPEKAKQKQN